MEESIAHKSGFWRVFQIMLGVRMACVCESHKESGLLKSDYLGSNPKYAIDQRINVDDVTSLRFSFLNCYIGRW